MVDLTKLRSTEDPEMTYVVRPDGSIRTCACAPGINTHYLISGTGELRPERAAEGFILLRDAYEQDDLGLRGWEVFCEYRDARKRGMLAELDPAWLPAIARERQAATQAAKTWRCPPPPKPAKKGAKRSADANAE